MNYLWQEGTCCNNQRGNLEGSGSLLLRGRCPYPLHINHNTGPAHTDVLKPVLANFSSQTWKLTSPGMLDWKEHKDNIPPPYAKSKGEGEEKTILLSLAASI